MFILFTGDIAELRDSVKMDDEHIAAFSDDCSTMSKRFSLIDVRMQLLHTHLNTKLGIALS